MTVHDLEVRFVRTLAALLFLFVGIPVLLFGTVFVFTLSLLWPSRLIERWSALLKDSNPNVSS